MQTEVDNVLLPTISQHFKDSKVGSNFLSAEKQQTSMANEK